MIEYDDGHGCGNGNGNKFNLRIEMLENLLEASGDETSAKINSLRQAIHRSKSDMAEDLNSSLDLLRQVFQAEMTEEIRQVLDRHVRTTFSPALENLRRNGFEIREADLNDLCINILEATKEPFLHPEIGEMERTSRKIIPSASLLKPRTTYNQSHPNAAPNYDSGRIYESEGNESDTTDNTSQLGGNDPRFFNRPRKRGRPRKIDVDTGRSGSPLMNGTQQVSFAEAFKWNPERIQSDSRFILGSKVNKLLSMGHRCHVFVKYPRIFRYVGDEEDKAWLFDRNISTRMSGKVFFMLVDDVLELAMLENALPNVGTEIQRCSFLIPEKIILKMKASMCKPFEALKQRIAPASPLHINPNVMISSPSSILSTEVAMTNMVIRQQDSNSQDRQMESIQNNLSSLASSGLLGTLNGTSANITDNLNLTNSLMNFLNSTNHQQFSVTNQQSNGFGALNHLQIQNGQQNLLNALAPTAADRFGQSF